MDPMGTVDGSEHVRPFYNWVLSDEQMRNQVRAARTNQTSSCGVCYYVVFFRFKNPHLK